MTNNTPQPTLLDSLQALDKVSVGPSSHVVPLRAALPWVSLSRTWTRELIDLIEQNIPEGHIITSDKRTPVSHPTNSDKDVYISEYVWSVLHKHEKDLEALNNIYHNDRKHTKTNT